MSWGGTVSELITKYPDIQWQINTVENAKIYIMEDIFGGIKADDCYTFIENKFKNGSLLFQERTFF